jgi:hypothetical protein
MKILNSFVIATVCGALTVVLSISIDAIMDRLEGSFLSVLAVLFLIGITLCLIAVTIFFSVNASIEIIRTIAQIVR